MRFAWGTSWEGYLRTDHGGHRVQAKDVGFYPEDKINRSCGSLQKDDTLAFHKR